MTAEANSKRYTGPAPFGFDWEGKRLVANESEAVIRRRTFELFVDKPLKGQVARILNEEGYRTRRGSKIRDVHVNRWLTCSSAIGDYAVNKTRKGVLLPPEEWMMIECEAIVERKAWDAVQAILSGGGESAPKKAARPAADPLTPLVYCRCGASMVLEPSSRKFICRDCQRRIPRSDLEAIILEEVREYLSNRQDILQALLDTSEPVVDAEGRLREHRVRLRETETKMSRIHELYMSGSIGVERFGELHHPLEEQRTELKAMTPTLEHRLAKAKEDHPETESRDLDVDGLVELWSELPLEAQRVILTELFEKVVVGDGEIQIQELLPTTPLRAPTSQQVDSPTSAPQKTSIDEPIYIRLPKPGTRCERTGLTRSMLNELILATERNQFRPPVKSFSVKRGGNVRGPRFIVWESLKSYLAKQQEGEI